MVTVGGGMGGLAAGSVTIEESWEIKVRVRSLENISCSPPS